MPRNVPLAVIWRLLLLAAAVAGVLAIGIREYGWQPIGAKQMPPAPKEPDGMVVRQEMPEETPWAEPELEPAAPAPPAETAPPEAAPPGEPAPPKANDKTPPPKPDKTPAPDKPKKMEQGADEQALEDLLNEEVNKKKKKKK